MKRQFLIILHLLLVLALSSCGKSPATSSQPSRLPDPKDVKALLVQLVDMEKKVPAIVVGMMADDPQERWVIGYGRLSATDRRVPDGNTVFEIASITKVFTGTLLAQAVVKGEVKLDDPISQYLPEGVTAPEYNGRSITLLDLATHTSALPRESSTLSYAHYTLDQMYAFLSSYRLLHEPGSRFEYSNYGFGLLGNLLVRRAGTADYEALLLERIVRPLGMDSTRIGLTRRMRSRLAPPHMSYSVPASSWNAPAFAGAGSIRSTANDMLKFLAANMGLTETELQPALQLANTPQRPRSELKVIGLGWWLDRSGVGIHWHGGATPGYNSYLAWDPQRKIGVVVLVNAAIDIQGFGLQLMRGLPKPFPVDPQVLAEYAGRYQDPDAGIVTIRVDVRRIFIQPPGEPEYEIVACSENHFYCAADAECTFHRNDSGKVDRMVFVTWCETHEAKKVP